MAASYSVLGGTGIPHPREGALRVGASVKEARLKQIMKGWKGETRDENKRGEGTSQRV